MRHPIPITRSACALGAMVAALALPGCFSERSSVTLPSVEELCTGAPQAGVVQIRNYAFTPVDLRVAPGTEVTWVNCDEDSHTSTSDAQGWNSGLLAPGTGFSRTFDQAGRFAYHCEPHPFMTASVTVQ